MSRGITEIDVWQACDALLLDGARPTIERVRQKIGRGSPNTVSPHLDAWFKQLGGRIKNPAGFAAQPEWPDAVLNAAQHLWMTALAETRADFDQRLAHAMAAAMTTVETEKARSAQAEEAVHGAHVQLQQLQTELVMRDAALEAEKLTRAASAAHLQGAAQQIADLRRRLEEESAELTALRAQAQREVAAANERSAGAERRAALQIDSERTMRSRAEKRMEALERRLEASQVDLLADRARRVEAATQLQADLTHAQQDLARALKLHSAAAEQIDELANALIDAQRRAEVAEARASIGERVLERLGESAGTLKSKAKPGRRGIALKSSDSKQEA